MSPCLTHLHLDRIECCCVLPQAAALPEAKCELPPVDKAQPLRNSVLGRDVADDVRDEYEIGPVLGVGQFGVTRLAVHKETRHSYACKSISKSNLHTSEASIIKQELQIMHHVAGEPGGRGTALKDVTASCTLAAVEDTTCPMGLCKPASKADEHLCVISGQHSRCRFSMVHKAAGQLPELGWTQRLLSCLLQLQAHRGVDACLC